MSYENDRHAGTKTAYHWIFLALPPPLPETLISASSNFYITTTIDSWTGQDYKGTYNPEAMETWVEQYRDPAVILGALEDYRAGASIDLDHDEEDEKNGTDGVDCPVLVLASHSLFQRFEVKKIWENIARQEGARVKQIGDEGVGHFFPLERGEETSQAVVDWIQVR
jgi:haloacetate dehalogenase